MAFGRIHKHLYEGKSSRGFKNGFHVAQAEEHGDDHGEPEGAVESHRS